MVRSPNLMQGTLRELDVVTEPTGRCVHWILLPVSTVYCSLRERKSVAVAQRLSATA